MSDIPVSEEARDAFLRWAFPLPDDPPWTDQDADLACSAFPDRSCNWNALVRGALGSRPSSYFAGKS